MGAAGLILVFFNGDAKRFQLEVRFKLLGKFFEQMPKGPRSHPSQGAGSGVIISEDGYILSNNHVVEGAKEVSVTLANEKEYPATSSGVKQGIRQSAKGARDGVRSCGRTKSIVPSVLAALAMGSRTYSLVRSSGDNRNSNGKGSSKSGGTSEARDMSGLNSRGVAGS